MLAMSTG